MASLKDRLKMGLSKTPACDDTAIKELISKAFSTRNSIHFAHLASKSFAEHEALGFLYNAIIEKIDEIVECYQGKFGVLSGLTCAGSAVPADLCAHVKAEALWLAENRCKISCDNDAIAALLDELEASYLKTIYKLENLK